MAGGVQLVNAINNPDPTGGVIPLNTDDTIATILPNYVDPFGSNLHLYGPRFLLGSFDNPSDASAALGNDETLLRLIGVAGVTLTALIGVSPENQYAQAFNIPSTGGSGSITTQRDPQTHSVINITNSSHVFYNGLVIE